MKNGQKVSEIALSFRFGRNSSRYSTAKPELKRLICEGGTTEANSSNVRKRGNEKSKVAKMRKGDDETTTSFRAKRSGVEESPENASANGRYLHYGRHDEYQPFASWRLCGESRPKGKLQRPTGANDGAAKLRPTKEDKLQRSE